MDKFNIVYDIDPTTIVYTLIAIAYKWKIYGYLTIADSIKLDAHLTIWQTQSIECKNNNAKWW